MTAAEQLSSWLTGLTRRVNQLHADVKKARGRSEAERLTRAFNSVLSRMNNLKVYAERHGLATRFEARFERMSLTLEQVDTTIRRRTTPWWKRAAAALIWTIEKTIEVSGGWQSLLGRLLSWVRRRLLPAPREPKRLRAVSG